MAKSLINIKMSGISFAVALVILIISMIHYVSRLAESQGVGENVGHENN